MAENENIIAEIKELYNMHGELLYCYLIGILRNKEDAEDVLQAVFLKFTRLKNGIFGIRNKKSYLFRVARNEALNYIKSRKLRVTEDGETEMLEVADKSMDKKDAFEMEAAIKTLPSDQSEVLMLKVYKEMTFEEIAEVLGISQNTAASRYRYAMEKLKTMVKA